MALIRWQPFQEIETLRRQFDQLFDELAGSNQQSQIAWAPSVELQDTESSLILRAQIPGIEAKDLDVQVTRDAVAISGEHRSENKANEKGYFRSEFRYGKFQRLIPLPVHIKNDQVQADFKNGVLTLTLPKLEAPQRQVVKINLGENLAMSGSENSATLEATQPEEKHHATDGDERVETQESQPVMTS